MMDRVASCGHSLHRDCLRFYGFVNMVACFRYASIDVHSVYLPPSKLDFNFGNQYWIQRELNEVIDRAELLFSEVLNSLRQIVERRPGTGSHISIMKNHELRRCLVDLEGMVHKEKSEFEVFVAVPNSWHETRVKRPLSKPKSVEKCVDCQKQQCRLVEQ